VQQALSDARLSPGRRQELARAYAGQAKRLLEEAVARSPDNPGACNELAEFLATCPVSEYRDPARAAALWLRLVLPGHG
jgi:hypothetical protein